jgi:hypothetical protein
VAHGGDSIGHPMRFSRQNSRANPAGKPSGVTTAHKGRGRCGERAFAPYFLPLNFGINAWMLFVLGPSRPVVPSSL